jgi:hypothetical protein
VFSNPAAIQQSFKMSTSSIQLTPTIVQELLEKHRETLLQSLAKMLSTAPPAPSSPAPAGKKAKKVKAPADPDAPPKEKRAPNAWIVFAMRVEKIVRAAEELAGKTTKEERMHTIVIKQFASSLKAQKGYDEWTDDEITEAHSTWTPPEMSKQAAAKAAAPVAPAEPEAEAVHEVEAAATAPPAEKPKHQWSEEAKAAAAAKRAAKKAAGTPAEVAAEAAPAPAPTKKAVTMKPKKAAASAGAPAPTAKKLDLSFYSWTHDGKEYYTNDRGDVATTDFEWVGRFNGTIIDESVPEPADLSEATLRE